MNTKTAKLLELYAADSQISSRALKAEYLKLSNRQKREFRIQMEKRLKNVLGGRFDPMDAWAFEDEGIDWPVLRRSLLVWFLAVLSSTALNLSLHQTGVLSSGHGEEEVQAVQDSGENPPGKTGGATNGDREKTRAPEPADDGGEEEGLPDLLPGDWEREAFGPGGGSRPGDGLPVEGL